MATPSAAPTLLQTAEQQRREAEVSLPAWLKGAVKMLIYVSLLAYGYGQLSERVNNVQSDLRELRAVVIQVLQNNRADIERQREGSK